MQRLAPILRSLALGAVALAAGGAPAGAQSGAPALAAGDPAPPFAVTTTKGRFAIPVADGKPTLLEVFATWCPHCRRMMPVLDRVAELAGASAHVVAVVGSARGADGAPESRGDVFSFADDFGATFPVGYDPSRTVARGYLQSGFPTFVIIRGDGRIAAVDVGETPGVELLAALRSAGAKLPKDVAAALVRPAGAK